MEGRFSTRSSVDDDLRGFELMLEQRESITNDLIEIGFAELGGGGAREIQQAVGDFGGAETLLRNFFEHGAEARIAAHLLGEHLRIGRDDCEGGIDFVGYAGGEQADGAEFVSLRELSFERDALGDVVDEDDAAYDNKVAREKRGDGDVDGALFAGAGW